MMKRKTKKSETLQVRLPLGMKRDFMQRCETEGRAASDLVRDFIESYLARPVEILTSEKAVMIRRTFIYPSLAAAALFGAIVILAPGTGQATSLREDFAAMDANGDDFVVLGEFKRPADGVMYSMHAPGRGSTAPGPSAPPSKPGAIKVTNGQQNLAAAFSRLDTNGDQKLSFEEYRIMRLGAAMVIFKRGDANADQRLTEAEYIEGVSIPAAVVARLKAQAPAAPIEAGIAQARQQASARFKLFDADHDGALTLAELTPS